MYELKIGLPSTSKIFPAGNVKSKKTVIDLQTILYTIQERPVY